MILTQSCQTNTDKNASDIFLDFSRDDRMPISQCPLPCFTKITVKRRRGLLMWQVQLMCLLHIFISPTFLYNPDPPLWWMAPWAWVTFEAWEEWRTLLFSSSASRSQRFALRFQVAASISLIAGILSRFLSLSLCVLLLTRRARSTWLTGGEWCGRVCCLCFHPRVGHWQHDSWVSLNFPAGLFLIGATMDDLWPVWVHCTQSTCMLDGL